jgi:Putative beta-lactamase-inhibitor-like, PepSY-like
MYMKKSFKITIVLVLGGLFVNAQKIDVSKVPAAVKTGFTKQFPGATPAWEKEAGKYEANFKQNGNSMSALFEVSGTMTESEMGMAVSALPATVLTYVKEHYKGKIIKEAAKITKADGTVNYEAAINGKDIIFDANGGFLKETKD